MYFNTTITTTNIIITTPPRVLIDTVFMSAEAMPSLTTTKRTSSARGDEGMPPLTQY